MSLCAMACPGIEPCCFPDGTCGLEVSTARVGEGESFVYDCLGDVDHDGYDNACRIALIPTANAWGLVVMALLLATLGRIYFAWRYADPRI